MKKYDFKLPLHDRLYVSGSHIFIFILELSPVVLTHLAKHQILVIQALS